MDMEHPNAEKRWDTDRDETEAQRLDRNWSSLLQELRVTQTGVQLLTGFLLTLPFQARFTQLDDTMRTAYLGVALAGVGVVIFDTVAGRTGAWLAGGCTLAAFITFWFLIPLPLRRKSDRSY